MIIVVFLVVILLIFLIILLISELCLCLDKDEFVCGENGFNYINVCFMKCE